jgi:hypothetical protein
MATWKYSDKNVSKEKAEESLKAIKSACFGCDTHNADCSIAKAAGEVSAMSVKEEIHSQIEGALKNANFPINTPTELLAAMPNGAATKCKSGDVELTAGDAGKVLTASDFPFKSAKQVADVIVQRAGL